MAFNPQEFLKTVPSNPGVYIMRNNLDAIIYVGKAKNLKNRLSSYFRSQGLTTKTQMLVMNIESIEMIITNTENEALLLENNLIKQHKPRYNVSLIDDKSYPYIYLSHHKFPRFSYYRGQKKLKGKFFGPYPSSTIVRETLDLMKKIFKVRQCEDSFFNHRTRPCLQYQINRCSAPCVNKISFEDYKEDVNNAALFLNGQSTSLIESLAKEMNQYVEALAFEKAAIIRDQIQSLQFIQRSNDIEKGASSLDTIVYYYEAEIHLVEVLTIRDGRVLGAKAYYPKVPQNTEPSEILGSFIQQYYTEEREPPARIILNHPLEKELETWLLEAFSTLIDRKVHFLYNVRGQNARWLELTEKNAKETLAIKLAGKSSIDDRLQALSDLLKVPLIKRIECFDISHSFGEKTVASDVVYTEEGFTKKLYRRFNIEGITAGDDYAAMHQAMMRRFKKIDENEAPDILLIDGGKNQLHIGEKVVEELGIQNMILIGVAKGEGRKVGLETLWRSGFSEPIEIDSTSKAFHLITQIRDEAHRFAIEGHRQQRDKLRRRSLLEDVSGIGPQRRAKLLTYFGGLESLKKASVEDIAKVPGIHQKLAEVIYTALHPKEK